MTARAPRVSLGLPVFNGERFLAATLDSLLGQTFEDFELIISDNASTDRTQAICRDYASRDSRVRYHRRSHNAGAAANFNRCFELATGEYFKWAASDDLLEPRFLECCVRKLDEDAGAALAYTKARIIDDESREVRSYEHKLPTDSTSPIARYSALLEGHKCFEVFGLIRRETLEQTPLIGAYAHGDGVLLTRLAFLGRFEQLPEYLFLPRRHAEQSMSMLGDYRRYAEWFDPRLGRRMVFPYWRIYYEFYRSIGMSPLGWRDRLRCFRRFARWAWIRRREFVSDIAFNLRRLARRPAPDAGAVQRGDG